MHGARPSGKTMTSSAALSSFELLRLGGFFIRIHHRLNNAGLGELSTARIGGVHLLDGRTSEPIGSAGTSEGYEIDRREIAAKFQKAPVAQI